MNANAFLLVNLSLAFYGVGAIWAHEVDIFRSWKLLDAQTFRTVQSVHWHKLPYWVLAPVALTLAGSTALIFYHPVMAPVWAIWSASGCQIASAILTAMFWGPWQAKLSKDPLGPASPWLSRILATHWLRTLLINLYGLILLVWAIIALG